MSVGYVGLGQMGSAMVGRLLDAAVPVIVFDLDSGRSSDGRRRGDRHLGTRRSAVAPASTIASTAPSPGRTR
jgi:3-hydroxyisobutyrate dehydrogenase-like beta-hydroxyacid dehydrogenase